MQSCTCFDTLTFDQRKISKSAPKFDNPKMDGL